MKIRIKRLLEEAVIPKYAVDGDAGLDLTAIAMSEDADGNICYYTGLALEIPRGYVGLIFPRSSICKQDLLLTNSVGVIDSGYRGEISFKFKPTQFASTKRYEIGDRVGQLIIIPYPNIEFEEVDTLSESDRGTNGYGHTGN